MCRILCVSEAGYYKYKRNLGKPGKDETLSAAIKSIIDESEYNDNLGVPRMQLALMQRNIKAGIRRITRLMCEMDLIHKPHRKPKGLTKATTEAQERENLIKQDFSADKPLKKLLTDISQIQCEDGKLYISPIMDCCNGEILFLCMDSNMKKELCIETFRGVSKRYNIKGAICHSDYAEEKTMPKNCCNPLV